MTVAMTPAVCRLLFVCFFCTLWGGQVIASDVVKQTEAKEAMEKTVGKLEEAEKCAKELETLLKESSLKVEDVKKKANCTAEGVKNATAEANTILSEEAVKALLPEASEEAKKLLAQLKELQTNAEGINTTAKDLQDAQPIEQKYKEDVKKIISCLEEAKKAATDILNALTKTIKEVKENEKVPPNKGDSHSPSGEQGGGPKGNNERDGPNSQTGAQNSGANSPARTEGNKSSTGGSNKNSSTSSSTHEDNTSDGAHGGAIATWSSFVPLLTAVAYAAVC